MAGQRFSHELSDLPAQMFGAGIVLSQKYRRARMSGGPCLKCGRHNGEPGTGLCVECGGGPGGWRTYRPDREGDPPFHGANWVPLDDITARKVGQ